MELSNKQIDFCKASGLNQDVMKSLLSEGEYDGKAAGEEYTSIQQARIESQLKESLKESIHAEALSSSSLKVMRDINKKFELGLSNSDIKEMKLQDFIENARETVDGRMESAKTGTDETLQAKIKELNDKYVNTLSSHEQTLTAKEQEWNDLLSQERAKVSNFIIRSEFNKVFDTIKLGIPETQIPVWKDRIIQETLNKYNVKDGGVIANKDNDGIAISFDETKKWTKVSDPINYLVDKYELRKKSGGSGGADGVGGAGSGSNNPPPQKIQGWGGMNLK